MPTRKTEQLIQSLLRDAELPATVKQLNILVNGVAELLATKEAAIKELVDGLWEMVKTYDTFTGNCPIGSALYNAKSLIQKHKQ